MAAEMVERTWWATNCRACPEDCIVIALHSLLLSKNFTCVSLSDEGFADVSTVGTTTSSAEKPGLPDGWNSADVYTLQYRQNASGRKALVKGIKMEGDLLILNMAVDNCDSVANVTVTSSDHVNTDKLTTVTGAFQDLSQLLSLLDKELVSSVFPPKKTPPTTTSTREEHASREAPKLSAERRGKEAPPPLDPLRDPLRVGPPRGARGRVPPYGSAHYDPFSVGHNDLDPFGGMGLGGGGGGGGMLMDPFRSGRLGETHGFRDPTTPPGARFDPYGPFPLHPGRGRRLPGGEPNPDHLPPPGFDDMFM